MISQPLTVMVVSPDRAILREFCWLLTDFGYRVLTATETRPLEAYVEEESPQILIVDERAGDVCARLAGRTAVRGRRARPFMLLVSGSPAEISVPDALEAGFDDFLTKPLSHAEVLARLRTAARGVEFDRRLAAFDAIDPATSLYTRSGAITKLQREVEAGSVRQASSAALEIDLCEQIEKSLGKITTAHLLRHVAQLLLGHCDHGILAARLSDRRFGALLPTMSVDKAVKWAERVREALSANPFLHHEKSIQVTVSCGIAGDCVDHATHLQEEFWDNAEEALEIAIASGGDLVVPAGSFDGELAKWRACLTRGNPFSGAKARDVMTPFTLWATIGESAVDAANKLTKNCLPLLPVRDENHRLLGLVRHEDLSATRSMPVISGVGVEELMVTSFVKLSEQSDYAVVMGHFFADDERPVVIYHDDEPRGFVTKSSFSALVSPLQSDSFAARCPASGCQGLLVPDMECDDGTVQRVRPTAAEESGLLVRMTAAANISDSQPIGAR
jgi:diguanylate cyclase (GGDEF)-like protein